MASWQAGGKDYGLPHKDPSNDGLKPLDQFILADMGHRQSSRLLSEVEYFPLHRQMTVR